MSSCHFFRRLKSKPSEVDTHILTPPKLMSKDGVFGFDRKGSITNEKFLTWNPFEEYVHQNLRVLECFINLQLIKTKNILVKKHASDSCCMHTYALPLFSEYSVAHCKSNDFNLFLHFKVPPFINDVFLE